MVSSTAAFAIAGGHHFMEKHIAYLPVYPSSAAPIEIEMDKCTICGWTMSSSLMDCRSILRFRIERFKVEMARYG